MAKYGYIFPFPCHGDCTGPRLEQSGSGFRFYCLFHRIQKMYYGEKEYYIQNYIRVGRDQDVVNIKYIYLVCLGNFKHLN